MLNVQKKKKKKPTLYQGFKNVNIIFCRKHNRGNIFENSLLH